MKQILAPLTAIVFQILVSPGERVASGSEIMLLEAMKMEIPVETDSNGVVAHVLVKEGDAVQEGDPLLELDDGV